MAITRSQIARQLMQEGGVPRQGYFLGKLVKKFKDDIIPNELKSPAGVAAALTAANFAPKFIPGGSDQTLLQRFLPSVSSGIQSAKSAVGNIFRGPDGFEGEEGPRPTYSDQLKKIQEKGGGVVDFFTKDRLGTGKSIADLLMTPQALALGSGLLAGAFTKDKEDPIYTGQDVGLNLQDIAKLANITDPKTASAIGLRFSPDVESRKFTPEEMAATYAANAPQDFTEKREQAQDGGIMGDQKDFEEFLQDMQDRDKSMLQDRIMEDFEKFMKRKRMIENLPEAKDGGIMKVKPKKISMEPGQENTLEQIYFDLIDAGMSPDEASKKAREIYMNMSSGMAEGGMMDMGGMEMDLRGGGFVPMGRAEKADDVPARLSKNEFVFTADAVRAAGGGNVDKGADQMYATMKKLEDRVA